MDGWVGGVGRMGAKLWMPGDLGRAREAAGDVQPAIDAEAGIRSASSLVLLMLQT